MVQINNIPHNNFALDFSNIVLTRDKKRYEGPGSIFQNEEGNFELKMYTKDKSGFSLFTKKERIKPGKIIPKSQYFKLTAIDYFNNEWYSDNVRFGYTLASDLQSLILRAPIYYFYQKIDVQFKFKRPSLQIKLLKKNLSFPIATFIDSDAQAHKNINKNQSLSIIANFLHNNFEFLFYQSEDWFFIDISTNKGRISEKIEKPVCEALQFILSKNIYWVVLEKFEGQKEKVIIRNPRQISPSLRVPPPIELNTANVEDVWKLFKKYFDFVLKNKSDDHHYISSKLHNLIQSSNGSLELQALSVTTLIESVVKNDFSKFTTVSKTYDSDINKLNRLFKKYKFSKDFQNRVSGFLPNLNKANVKSILKSLIEYKLITKSDLFAWEKLRHPVVHGERINFTDFQKYLTLCYRTQMLFNKLIFLLIGYNGSYTNFSKIGFPKKYFKKSITSKSTRPHR